MAKLAVFMHLTLDGYYAGPKGEIDWFKSGKKDDEYERYTHEQSQSGDTLIFGRTTYEMMKGYWPTPEAIRADPEMARVVDHSPKIVFSKTLQKVAEEPNWKNITIVHEIEPAGIRRLKAQARGDLTTLGSGSVVQQFANFGLIDEYRLVLVPIVLGAGKALFQDLEKTSLDLLESRSFQNGLTVLRYRPD